MLLAVEPSEHTGLRRGDGADLNPGAIPACSPGRQHTIAGCGEHRVDARFTRRQRDDAAERGCAAGIDAHLSKGSGLAPPRELVPCDENPATAVDHDLRVRRLRAAERSHLLPCREALTVAG